MKIECEGYKIAYSANDETCSICKVAVECEKSTILKLTEAGIDTGKGVTTMITSKEKFEATLASITTKKALGTLNKDEKLGVKPPKGSTLDDIKDLLLQAAFPVKEEAGSDDPDDDFDADDLDADGDDDFDADDGSEAATEADVDVNQNTADALEEDGAADIEKTEDTTEELDDPEDIDTLNARVTMLEKRLDEVLEMMKNKPAEAPAAKSKSSKAEKDAAKAKLLESCPYDKTTIAELNGREVKQLASALGIKSFGMKQNVVVAAILKSKANKTANK